MQGTELIETRHWQLTGIREVDCSMDDAQYLDTYDMIGRKPNKTKTKKETPIPRPSSVHAEHSPICKFGPEPMAIRPST
jgi:hypothetical protein